VRIGFAARQDSAIWRTLYNFQRDAATGIINKLETFNGCILADSVGLGKTFTALAVIKYYELRNRDVLVLCPKKLADNWLTYNRKLVTNTLAEDRFRYDVLCHTDLQRDSGSSFGTPLNQVNWGNYDLVVIDESHNFRNDDVYKDRETRYQRLMQRVIRAGVKTKVLMLSATPVNNRFSDLKNQLALAYEGETGTLDEKLKIGRSVNQVFRQAQRAFNEWSRRPPEERTPEAILGALDFDFFELLDSVTIARSRRHIETFPDDDLFQDIDDDDAAAGLIGGKVRIALADMDLTSWERDLRADLGVLDALHAEMARITPEHDAKLQDLRTLINSKLASPINPGNRKVLLFTAFADTADYLYANLAQPLRQAHGIHTGKVTGADGPKSTLARHYDFQSLLTLFAPRAKRKAEILPNEPAELDLLIATDCISEGQNLQDCDYLVNYDIHWNPVRIIQRFGRIDRIGSPNACIQLVNFWPAITLDEYINLKERVENRMVIVDAVGTGNDNPLTPAAENDIAYRKEQLRRLQDEVVEIEDLKTGVAITDLGLNDFRIDCLFTGQRTTALLDDIEGLDDFELINFLVVLESAPDTASRTA
jgi:SNF2 family DNA or RNA helicase